MKINQALTHFTELLSAADFIDAPRKEAAIFVRQVLGLEEHMFILEKDLGEIGEDDFEKVAAFVRRRLSGESVAGITGSAFFYTLEFYVNEHVLIPRPETELLIEKVLGFTSHLDNVLALDIGTGSGCIPITLIKEHKGMRFDALDSSEKALEAANINRTKHHIDPERLTFIHRDIKEFEPAAEYDLIISNPPYIKSEVVKDILQDKSVSDPAQALDGGTDGLDFYRHIKEFSDSYLKKGGLLFLEHGFDQKEELLAIFASPLYQLQSYKDYADHDRILFARKIAP